MPRVAGKDPRRLLKKPPGPLLGENGSTWFVAISANPLGVNGLLSVYFNALPRAP